MLLPGMGGGRRDEEGPWVFLEQESCNPSEKTGSRTSPFLRLTLALVSGQLGIKSIRTDIAFSSWNHLESKIVARLSGLPGSSPVDFISITFH